MEELPLTLSNAIERELTGISPEKLQDASFDLTQRYSQGKFIKTQLHRYAYMAARLPVTYGVSQHIFRHIDSFLHAPSSILDLGTGMGGLAWAAADAFSQLQQITLVEKDIEMLRIGQLLARSIFSVPENGISSSAMASLMMLTVTLILRQLRLTNPSRTYNDKSKESGSI